MKKVDLLVSLICVEAVLCVSYLTLLSHWSETSKGILLILSSSVCLSVALLVTLEWRDTSNTTRRPGGLNQLASLAAAEERIAARGKTKTSKCQCPECDWKSPYGGHT